MAVEAAVEAADEARAVSVSAGAAEAAWVHMLGTSNSDTRSTSILSEGSPNRSDGLCLCLGIVTSTKLHTPLFERTSSESPSSKE